MGYTPHAKQQRFLLHADTREVFFGGAGGGGKSQAMWFAALQYVDVPGYSALILRRTYADLSLPSSLMSRSQEYLTGTGAVWNENRKTWTFPSGAKIVFGYLETEKDKYRYAGAELQMIAFDELTQFAESQYRFLFTRLRRVAGVDVPLRMRSASNPGASGHRWVKARFIDQSTREPNAVFIPARMEDNPSLDAAGYRESLANADPLTRRQIEHGDWEAESGGRLRREWLRYWRRDGHGSVILGDRKFYEDVPCYVTIDPAATDKTSSDYTVVSTWKAPAGGDLVWWDCERARIQIPDQPALVKRVVEKHRPQAIIVETVGGHQALYQEMARMGLPVRQVTPNRKMGDKLQRGTPLILLAEKGKLWLPGPRQMPGFPTDDVENEILSFTGIDDEHDDVWDTAAYAAIYLPEFVGKDSFQIIRPDPRPGLRSQPNWAADKGLYGLGKTS